MQSGSWEEPTANWCAIATGCNLLPGWSLPGCFSWSLFQQVVLPCLQGASVKWAFFSQHLDKSVSPDGKYGQFSLWNLKYYGHCHDWCISVFWSWYVAVTWLWHVHCQEWRGNSHWTSVCWVLWQHGKCSQGMCLLCSYGKNDDFTNNCSMPIALEALTKPNSNRADMKLLMH